MLRLLLVRHGETEWNRLLRVQGGGSDTELNEKGRSQARALALRLKEETVVAIYSSPLQRALDTTREIASYHRLEIHVEPSFRELNVGELEGVPIKSLGKRVEELLVARESNETCAAPGDSVLTKLEHIGCETLAELQQRAWKAVQRIANQHSDGVVVVVSHYFVILSIVCALIDFPVTRIGRFRLDSGSITTIIFDEPFTHLRTFNDVCHLSGR